jgi:hypothetical protein
MGSARYAALILGIALFWPPGLQADEQARSAAFGYVIQAPCYLYARIELRRQEGTRAGIDWLKSLCEGLQRVGGREYFLFAHRGIRYVVTL